MIRATIGILASQGGFVGLLDTYSGAAAAYSLRKLSATYTGSAIRVRRADNNNEQDIGFVNNELDTSTLTSFCSGTNGFVKTWYDQSGNGNDASNTTASEQPQIVNAGSVILENGKPAVNFSVSQNRLECVLSYTITSQSSFAVCKITSSASNFARILSQGDNGDDYLAGYVPILRNATNQAICSFTNTATASINISYNAQLLFASLHSGSQISNYLNSTTNNTATHTLNNSFTRFCLGGVTSTTSGTSNMAGNIQEIIIWNDNQSTNRTGIETNINDFYSIY